MSRTALAWRRARWIASTRVRTKTKAKSCFTSIPTSALTAVLANLFVPVNAIFFEDDVPEQWKHFIEMNRDYYFLSPEEFEAKYGRRP
jgi:hypothetical protein